MKKLIIILLFFTAARSFGQGFPTTDSLHKYDNRFITNSAINAFTDYRLNTLLHGMINWIDSARLGTGGTVGVDTVYAVNDSTLRYKKNGVTYSFSFKGVYDSRRKVDTVYAVNDSTVGFKINGVSRSIVIRGGVSSGGTWGSITGTLSAQTDLQAALDAKVPTARTLTINSTTFDLSANRSWSVGTLTNLATGYGLTGGPITSTGTMVWDSATAALTFLRRKDSVLYTTVSRLRDTAAVLRALVSGGGATDISITHAVQTVTVNSNTGADGTINYAKTTTAGVLSPLNSDIGHLPEIKAYMWATGLRASASATNYPYTLIDSNRSKFSSSGPDRGGWLTNNLTGDSVQVRAPFWVAFGDSQAEGHGPGATGRHGRLDANGTSLFDPAYPDSTGQITYHLRFLTNMRWYNHGVGGNNTTQCLRRFYRDVVGRPGTYTNSDTKGNSTLWYKPQGVVIIVGINDIAQSVALDVIKRNLELMASICQQEGIQCVMLNMPGDEVFDTIQARKVETINKWLAAGVMDQYGATIVDYNTWWKDATANDNYTGSTFIADDIHPSRVGYDSLSNYIFRSAHLPVLKRALFINELNAGGFTGYSRPTGFTIGGGPAGNSTAYTIANSIDSVTITAPVWDSTWIKTTATTNVTGTTFSGWGSIIWYTENNVDTLRVTKRTLYNNGSQKTDMTVSKMTIIPPSYASTDPVLSIPLADITTNSVGLQVFTDGGTAWMVLNGLTTNAKINNAILSIYGVIATSSNILTNGTSSRIGQQQILDNASASGTGYGFSVAGGTYSSNYQTTPIGGKAQFLLNYWSGNGTTTLGATSSTVTSLLDIPIGFGNAGNANQYGYGINLRGDINQAAAQTGIQFTGYRDAMTETSLTGSIHRSFNVLRGNAYFNTVNGNFGIGIDSNTTLTARLHIGAGTATASTAPLKLTSGTNLTSAEAGAFEYNGTSLFFSPSTTRLRTVLTDNSIPSNGQLPIGNGTNYTNATITSTGGTVTITNGSGTINLDIPSTVSSSGNYTATLTNGTNVASSSFVSAHYYRQGSHVIVYMYITIDPTSVGATDIGISLPIASNLVSGDLLGMGNCSSIAAQTVTIAADAANDRANLGYTATDINAQAFYITFSYEIK